MGPIVDDRLHEVSQGDWEGLVCSQMYTTEVSASAQELGNDFRAPGGESINDVRKRAFIFMGTVTWEQPGEDSTVLAFGHGFITRAIAGVILGWTHQQTREYPTHNTSVTLFEHDGQAWNVGFIGNNILCPKAPKLLI